MEKYSDIKGGRVIDEADHLKAASVLSKKGPLVLQDKEEVSHMGTLWLSDNSFQVSHPVSGETGPGRSTLLLGFP